ncbi:MAG TPA: sigma-70 family RNA polymerase sigma factor, partial [Thermomicrobiales bacterium]|nr:sigma-70 family RNA polymerase sigma factor [Thermomicrobiales bacterium]
MAQLAAGDELALTPLHDRYAGLVFRVVAHSLDRYVAEEITQDVFLTIWRKAGAYDPDRGEVRPWLLRIAQTRTLNELRRRGRRPRCVPDADEPRLAATPDDAPLPEDEVWRDERRAAVAAAVGALPSPQRRALSLAYFEDLTQQQVAVRLDVPLGTAKTHIRAGKQRLRDALLPIVASARERPAVSLAAPGATPAAPGAGVKAGA